MIPPEREQTNEGSPSNNNTYHGDATPAAPFAAICKARVAGTGTVDVETVYVPGVVACEHGGASFEALKAQAVAARTYLYWKIRNYGSIEDGTSAQVFSCGRAPSAVHYAAVEQTSGEILSYQGRPIVSFYVKGQPVDPNKNCMGQFKQGHITFNQDRRGNAVFPSTIGNLSHRDNRGCMAQDSAECLSQRGDDYRSILRYFYGEDIEIVKTVADEQGINCTVPIPPVAKPIVWSQRCDAAQENRIQVSFRWKTTQPVITQWIDFARGPVDRFAQPDAPQSELLDSRVLSLGDGWHEFAYPSTLEANRFYYVRINSCVQEPCSDPTHWRASETVQLKTLPSCFAPRLTNDAFAAGMPILWGYTCRADSDRVDATFVWLPSNYGDQWLDLSLYNRYFNIDESFYHAAPGAAGEGFQDLGFWCDPTQAIACYEPTGTCNFLCRTISPQTNWAYDYSSLERGKTHFLRVNTLTSEGWHPSPTFMFSTPTCR